MKKAQVSLEYIILTAFILIIVTIIFGLALLYYDANVKTVQVSNSIDSLVKTADLVYAKGYGTTLYTTVSWPDGVNIFGIIHKCKQGENQVLPDYLKGCPEISSGIGTTCYCNELIEGYECTGNEDCIKYSAVQVFMDDGTEFLQGSKAKLLVKTGESTYDTDPSTDYFPLGTAQ